MGNSMLLFVYQRAGDGSPSLNARSCQVYFIRCDSAVIRLLFVLAALRSQMDM